MEHALDILGTAAGQTALSLSHNWPYLLAGILVAAALAAFADATKVAAFLGRYRDLGVVAATGAAVATPLCSCGTTAVILGMMAGSMPLAPIVAFMVASPLSSPGELLYGAGLFGWPFALSHFAASVILGLAGGGIAAILERRGFLAGQARLAGPAARPGRFSFRPAASRRMEPREDVPRTTGNAACSCGSRAAGKAPARPAAARRFAAALLSTAGRLLPMFIGFAFVGYLLNALIPASLTKVLFGEGRVLGVPLAATIGLPLYLSSEASLPLLRALLDSGMSRGAAMAFLIAGSGTSIGAITGALTIARWKVVGLVVLVLWAGAILAGYAFDGLAAAGLA